MKTKTGLQKLMDWHSSAVTNDLYEHEMFYDKARTLLAEEQAQKPTADKGLVEELDKLLLGWPNELDCVKRGQDFAYQLTKWSCEIPIKVKEILSRYKPVEPLAVESLAERMIKVAGGNAGFHVHEWEQKDDKAFWEIESATRRFTGKTYSEAESKAREWLEKQEDKP